eukprot:5043673-Amphidinium_carterae.1
MALPQTWCRYFVFNEVYSSEDLALPGPVRRVRVGSCVIPMGWKCAVGLCQYLHRRLACLTERLPPPVKVDGAPPFGMGTTGPLAGALPLERESRK